MILKLVIQYAHSVVEKQAKATDREAKVRERSVNDLLSPTEGKETTQVHTKFSRILTKKSTPILAQKFTRILAQQISRTLE